MARWVEVPTTLPRSSTSTVIAPANVLAADLVSGGLHLGKGRTIATAGS